MDAPFERGWVAADDQAAVVSALTHHGLALVEGLADSTHLRRVTRSFATVVPHRDSASDGVTTLVDLGSDRNGAFAGFSSCALAPHTDRSGVANPPALLVLGCSQPATSGGQCVLIDGQAVYDTLADTAPDALAALCTPRSVLFGGASGHLGAIFTEYEGGRVTIRLRQDDLVQFSPEVRRWLPTLRAAIDQHVAELDLSAGQGYILDNHRWLHGRRAFNGHRVVHRVNANPLPHLGIRTGIPARVRSAAV
ncbi:TauD/TfdA family dioxygenase [Saccharothrix hoggarensis]|uniref:TauD/TfdA family dioxygenase n=1 Tax=Saccharothrix hoggarensis TaxID=913853 RepID=A0ABW3QYF2_9PSEU